LTTDLWVDVSGDGPAVVLLHEGVVDSRIWDRVAPLLADRHRVIRYDQRGFGRSPMPAAPYSLVGDLVSVLDEAGVERAALVGASRGGHIALTAAVDRPERVTALVLVGCPRPGDPLELDWTAEQIARWEAADAANDWEAMAELDIEMWAPLGADDRLRTMFVENAQGSNAEHETTDDSPVGGLGEIAVPTLVVIGGRDVLTLNGAGKRLARDIPGARLAVIEEADHMIPWRAPEELSHLIIDFLA
jgi:3-oxoadipate enol-lactonase